MAEEKNQKNRAEEKKLEENEEQDLEAEKAEEAEIRAEEVIVDEEGLSEKDHFYRQWQQEKDELLEQLKRKQADIDNLRRISKVEQAEAREYALHQFLSRLLPVLDNLERALESARSADNMPEGHVKGLEMIYNQLMQILEQEGVSKIEAVGCKFDPNCHHAVMQEKNDNSEPGTVLEELQKGYQHRKRILRPSMVKVCGE